MKKIIFRGFYLTLLFLSNYLDNWYLKKYKIILGTSLLMITSACQSPKKDTSGEVTCYLPAVPEYQDTVEIKSRDSSDILCYQSVAEDEDTIVPDSKNRKHSVKVADIPDPEILQNSYCDGESYGPETFIPCETVEQMPEFPGGTDALFQYIAGETRYPAIAQEKGIQGRVSVSFVIDKEGYVTNAEVMRSLDEALDEEALRVVNGMPQWKLGKHKGKNVYVKVRFTVPIQFKLPDKSTDK